MPSLQLPLAKYVAASSLIVLSLLAVSPASAGVTFTGSGTSTDSVALSAYLDLEMTAGNVLQITLGNTASAASRSSASTLTNVQIVGAPAPASALPSGAGTISLASGSHLTDGTPDANASTVLGTQWAYFSGANGGAASSGFGVGTGSGNLCGSTVCAGVPLDGAAYGLVSSSFVLANYHGSASVFVKNAVVIDIAVSDPLFDLSKITSIQFQYGTGYDDNTFLTGTCTSGCTTTTTNSNVPEPASLALLGTGFLGVGSLVRRRRSLKR